MSNFGFNKCLRGQPGLKIWISTRRFQVQTLRGQEGGVRGLPCALCKASHWNKKEMVSIKAAIKILL